ncbi:Hypothetical protein ABZS17H1_00879 [Kosakonia cowanii]
MIIRKKCIFILLLPSLQAQIFLTQDSPVFVKHSARHMFTL